VCCGSGKQSEAGSTTPSTEIALQPSWLRQFGDRVQCDVDGARDVVLRLVREFVVGVRAFLGAGDEVAVDGTDGTSG